ncbi:hypothetical protein Hanom_Chr07g00595601 [Helianthus anomalus]
MHLGKCENQKKPVFSTDETSLLGSSSHLESQENIHNTHSTNVLEVCVTKYTFLLTLTLRC